MYQKSSSNSVSVDFSTAVAKIIDDPDVASYRILQAAGLTQVKIFEEPIARIKRVAEDDDGGIAASPEKINRPYNTTHYHNHKAAVGFERMLGLLERNFNVDSCFFYTLTYESAQQSDYAIAVSDRTKLLRRLRDAFPGIKYVSAFGRHKSGGIHIHLVADKEIPRRSSSTIKDKPKKGRPAKSPCWDSFWPHGYVHVKRITQAPIGGPVAAYLKKNGMEVDLYGKHMFVASKNISGFAELRGDERKQKLHELISSGQDPFNAHVVENVPFAKKVYIFDFRTDIDKLAEYVSDISTPRQEISNLLKPFRFSGASVCPATSIYSPVKLKEHNEANVC